MMIFNMPIHKLLFPSADFFENFFSVYSEIHECFLKVSELSYPPNSLYNDTMVLPLHISPYTYISLNPIVLSINFVHIRSCIYHQKNILQIVQCTKNIIVFHNNEFTLINRIHEEKNHYNFRFIYMINQCKFVPMKKIIFFVH